MPINEDSFSSSSFRSSLEKTGFGVGVKVGEGIGVKVGDGLGVRVSDGAASLIGLSADVCESQPDKLELTRKTAARYNAPVRYNTPETN